MFCHTRAGAWVKVRLCLLAHCGSITLELTHVTTRVAAHFLMPPPPLRVMVARPAQVTQVTQVPNPLLHEPLHGIPCDTTHPMWRHRGTAQPKPPPPPLRGLVSSFVVTLCVLNLFALHLCAPIFPSNNNSVT